MSLQILQEEFVHQYRQHQAGPTPPFTVEFYAYSNLFHTIRIRKGQIIVRISDVLIGADSEVLASLLSILLHKLFERSVPSGSLRTYQTYIRRPEIRRKVQQMRRIRGRKSLTSPCGKSFDLEALFQDLNHRFFENQVQIRHLSWSRRKNRRILGHYDAAHQAIVIDRRLDNPLVPEYVVRYVLFHEMLHAALGEEEGACGRRRIHHRRFREAERRFPDYLRARKFIRRFL